MEHGLAGAEPHPGLGFVLWVQGHHHGRAVRGDAFALGWRRGDSPGRSRTGGRVRRRMRVLLQVKQVTSHSVA